MEGWKDGWMDGRESGVKDCLQQSTRPVWTGFKLAVRCKLPTHNYKVRCIDICIVWFPDGRRRS